jgi:cell division protein FtsQ
VSIDPRLVERRQAVAEERAKRNVGRLLRFFLAIAVLGGMVWFALSPWMSVEQVRTTGIVASASESILAEHRFVPGTPMVLLRTGPVVEALLADPWVAEADVRLFWPSDVVVRIVERAPAAWVETAGGWSRRAIDGHAVPGGTSPDSSFGWVRLPFLAEEDAVESELVRGSVEFLMSLDGDLARATSIRFEAGELWAEVDGHRVRLGRAVEMRAKAIALMALLEEEIPPGAVLVMVAPSNPAINTDGVDGEPEEKEAGDDGNDG